jgi:hypothetical protein
MIVVEFEVVLETICSGHNWKELVVLSHHKSISKRRYPIPNKVLSAVMLSTEYCRVQNHDEVRLIPGRRICDIGISRAMSRWTRSADCVVEFGYVKSLYGPKLRSMHLSKDWNYLCPITEKNLATHNTSMDGRIRRIVFNRFLIVISRQRTSVIDRSKLK